MTKKREDELIGRKAKVKLSLSLSSNGLIGLASQTNIISFHHHFIWSALLHCFALQDQWYIQRASSMISTLIVTARLWQFATALALI